METLLIADDEKNIRDGLKCILDWEELGFTLCGEAANGEEALSSILKNNPSLVLLDIRMPKLSGIDIIRIAREQGYSGRFIILSGYSDFAYAQAAIRYGVEYYLTKPIDEDELLDAINTIREAIEQERRKSDNIALYREKAKDVILHELITGVWKKDGITGLSSADFQNMELTSDIYQVVIYEKFGTSPDDNHYDFADLLNITNSGNHSFEHFEEDHKNVILLKGSFALRRFREFLDRYEKTDFQAGSPMDTLFLTYGHPVENLDEICLSYGEAYTLIRRRFFCTQGQHTLGYEDLPAMISQRRKAPRILRCPDKLSADKQPQADRSHILLPGRIPVQREQLHRLCPAVPHRLISAAKGKCQQTLQQLAGFVSIELCHHRPHRPLPLSVRDHSVHIRTGQVLHGRK